MEKQTARPEGNPESKPISPSVKKPGFPSAAVAGEAGARTPSQDVLFRKPDLTAGIIVRNLLNDLAGLAEALKTAIAAEDWLNAFLFAAGMWQIVEDYLHSDPLSLQRAEKVFEGLTHPLVMLPQGSVRLARQVETSVFRLAWQYRQVLRWSAAWAELVEALASAAVAQQPVPAEDQAHLAGRSLLLTSKIEVFPARLKRSILRLPNCFRSFDQKPADTQRLAAKFTQLYPDRDRPVVVVGLRTSGSYLAPLLKSNLHREGYPDVTLMTLRPGAALLPGEKARIRQAIRRGAFFTLIDDPPVSGQSMRNAAIDLEQAGIPHQSIVLLAPLFAGSDTLPALLKAYQSIVLPWEEWAIHDFTGIEAVRAVLSGWLLPRLKITRIEPILVMTDDTERGHITGLYQVAINEAETSRVWQREIFVKGAGLGYFGEHVLDMLQHLSPYFPTIYGLGDGLLFRAWISEGDQLSHLSDQDVPDAARSLAAYVWDRHRQLPVPEDTSLRRFGEWPAWEVASNFVARVYGRAWKLARVPLVDPLMRRLLRSSRPSIVDGNMALSNWFYQRAQREPAQGQVKKVAFERGVFRNDVEYTSYDPVYDLASLAAGLDMASLEGEAWAGELLALLRPAYESLSGTAIDEERWLLYQLVRLSEIERTLPANQVHTLRRAYSRAMQRYYAAQYFQDLPRNTGGEICAFDMDGVLETNYLRDASSLGFPALSPSSAAALRSLAQHGYRSIIVTGRSLPEVIERCALYPAAGGVAEYGAVWYVPSSGETRVLLTADEQAALSGLRKYIEAEPFIFVDPDYRYAVRAYRLDASSRRVGLTAGQINDALASLPAGSAFIRAIRGEDQTDFMAERMNKAVGARALLAELEGKNPGLRAGDKRRLALAVGDSPSDLTLLRLARQAAVPAHASRQMDQPGIRRYPKAYQAGLALAVSDLLHQADTGRCEQCQAPALSENARRLLALFAVQEDGTRSMLYSLGRGFSRDFLWNVRR